MSPASPDAKCSVAVGKKKAVTGLFPFVLVPPPMFHFPSTYTSQGSFGGSAKRTDGLNATQQRSSKNPLFLKIEEELHDARRVQSDGQEDDLRYALNMVINRVAELVRRRRTSRKFQKLTSHDSHQC